MTNFRKLTTATAALGVSALMSTAAFAEASDMTCGDFMKLDADGQKEAVMQIPNAGPEAEREAEAAAVDSEQTADSGVDPLDSGKDAQQREGRGADEMIAAAVEYCAGGDDLRVADTPSPAQDAMVE
ncbi:MAG TPA: hypothetical protein VIN05_01480 [Roseovarius sp.]